jgi:hypothetical protein
MEQNNLAALADNYAFSKAEQVLVDAGYANFGEWLNGNSGGDFGISLVLSGVELSSYLCPSDAGAARVTVLGMQQPTTVATATGGFTISGADDFAITNYAPNIGGIAITRTIAQNLVANWTGFYGPTRSRNADRIEGMIDGSSNVVLYGESLGIINQAMDQNWRYSLVLGGFGLGRPDAYGMPGQFETFATASSSAFIQFGSAHPGVVNVVRGDGSTLSVNRQVDDRQCGRFCGVADGLVFDLN